MNRNSLSVFTRSHNNYRPSTLAVLKYSSSAFMKRMGSQNADGTKMPQLKLPSV